MKKERRIGRILFITMLILHLLGCYVMGGISLFDTQTALESGFQIPYRGDLDVIGLVMGMELLFLGTMALLGIIWTRKKRFSGIYIGSAVGVYMFAFGIAYLIKFGSTYGLVVDGIRGFITIVFGYMAYQELKQARQVSVE